MTVTKRKVGRNLTEGPVLKTLLTFAIPMVLANMIQQFYSTVDLVIAGRYIGSTGTVGVSSGSEMADLLLPFATACASAGQIYIAQLIGARDEDRVKETIGTLLTAMFGISIVGAVAVVALNSQILVWIDCPVEAVEQARNYMIISALGFPFIFGYNGICSVLRGLGESKRPLIFVLVAAVANIFADMLFVIVLKMEAAGTAIATVLSQAGSFAAALVYLYRRREQFDFELKLSYFRIRKEPLAVIAKLAVPQLVKSGLVHFSMLWVNVNINGYGLVASATNSIGNKIQKFMNLFITSTETAASSMVAQNLGAKKIDRAKNTILFTLGVTTIVATIASILALTMPRQLYSIFTPDPEVIELGVEYMRILVMSLYMMAFTGSLQALVTGSGFVSLGFVLGIMDGVVCRIGFSLLFLHVFNAGVTSFFWGTAFSRTIPGLICLAYFLSGKWKTRKLLVESTKKNR